MKTKIGDIMKRRITIILITLIMFQLNEMVQKLSAQVPAQDSLALVALYDSTDGANWTDNTGWLTGTVSTWFGVTVSAGRVTEISLESNNLSGTIPSEIGNLTNLENLRLFENELTGSIPGEIYTLTNLFALKLEQNKLQGPISADIGNLVNLTSLTLGQNELTGSIPVEIGNLKDLLTCNLRFNLLSGSIPIELYSLTTLIVLNLSVNQLQGTIPPQIANLVNLREYSVPDNNMHGTIPDELGNLVELRHLWLAGNDFEGAIPNGVGSMPHLLFLRLENNQFTDLPDVSADTVLFNTQVQNNRFTFEDIEPNVGSGGFIYSPQDSVGDKQDVSIDPDSSLVLSVSVGGTANQYQWTKDGVIIQGAIDSSYTISSATASDEGSYVCEITNTIATELTLFSRAVNVTVSVSTGIEDQLGHVPETFSLNQNYPNPFNPVTNIRYELTKSSSVVLQVFDVLGREVRVLVNEVKPAGLHEVKWDGLNDAGLPVSSGLYLYRIENQNQVVMKKMVLMR